MPQEEINNLKIGIKNSFGNIKGDMDSIRLEVSSNAETIKLLIEQNTALQNNIKELNETVKLLIIPENPDCPEDKLKRDMLSKIDRNRKEIIKSRIIELVQSERYSIPEIKEIIVNRDCYCSKASFYRYMSELKQVIEEIKIGSRIIAVPIKPFGV